MFPCRVLPHLVADGPTQMAWDQWLLESVAADPSAAALRTYEWSEPTLSLGYFQPLSEALSDPRFQNRPIVRRSTGGGAIWHSAELTYALALPTTHPAAKSTSSLYEAADQAFIRLLSQLGWIAQPRGNSRETPDRPFLCFLDHDAHDLVVGGYKVLGHAQRRRSGAMLQHGSLLLQTSAETPELPGLDRLPFGSGTGHRYSPSQLAPLAVSCLVEALGLEPRPAVPGVEVAAQVQKLACEQFADISWTSRR